MEAPITLSQLAPAAQFRARVSVFVKAPPREALRAFEHVTLRDMPLAHLLGSLRYVLRQPPLPASQAANYRDRPFLELLIEGGTLVLHRSPTEIITGSAGKLHQIVDQEFKRFPGIEAFHAFSEPEHEKLFMHIRAEPVGPGECRLVLEHWTWALGEPALMKFRRYWTVIRPTGNLVSRLMLRAARKRTRRESRLRAGSPVAHEG